MTLFFHPRCKQNFVIVFVSFFLELESIETRNFLNAFQRSNHFWLPSSQAPPENSDGVTPPTFSQEGSLRKIRRGGYPPPSSKSSPGKGGVPNRSVLPHVNTYGPSRCGAQTRGQGADASGAAAPGRGGTARPRHRRERHRRRPGGAGRVAGRVLRVLGAALCLF